MRKWFTLLLLFGCACPAMAGKPITVDQLDQLLTKLHDKPDAKVAHELEDLQLSERVSATRLARWDAQFPGSHTQQELMKLADLSAFLAPPSSDVIPDPPPDQDTQRHMLWTAEQYVGSAASHLPDLVATRETTHFEAASSNKSNSADGGTKPFQWTGEYSETVAYRGGQEVLIEAARTHDGESISGLIIHGEFGPILSQVISDALASEVRFLRWEPGPSEPAAVFHYAVPEEASHFATSKTAGAQMNLVHPAYQGEIEIDPETGAVLRLSEIADMPSPHEAQRAAIIVDYAPVTIGDRSFICPVKGVALSRIPVPAKGATSGGGEAQDDGSWPLQAHLNDVTYSHYHE